MSDHVLVFIKAKNCSSCVILSSMANGIMINLRKIYPKLRMESVDMEDKHSVIIDTTKINIGLKKFVAGNYPIIMLVEGSEWDKSVYNTNVEFKFTNLKYFGKKWSERFGIISLQDENLPGVIGRPTFRNSKHLELWLLECLKNKNMFPGAEIYEQPAKKPDIEIKDMIPQNLIQSRENKIDELNSIDGSNDYCPVFNIIGVKNCGRNFRR